VETRVLVGVISSAQASSARPEYFILVPFFFFGFLKAFDK
jgi:hypothetical protein